VELRHLRYFVAVAEEGSFTRAAKLLNIAQSPLSSQIRHLEAELGVRLLERTTRSVALTNAGKELLIRAKSLLAGSERAIAATQYAATGESGSVSVGFAPMQVLSLLAPIAREVRRLYPDLVLDVHRILSSESQFRLLRDGVIDVSHAGYDTDGDDLVSEPVAAYPLAVVVSSSHRLAGARTAPLSDFRDDIFIGHQSQPPSRSHRAMMEACALAGFEPKRSHEVVDLSAHLALAAGGMGITVLPDMFRGLEIAGAHWITISEPNLVQQTHLVYRRDGLNMALRNYLEIARRVTAETVHG